MEFCANLFNSDVFYAWLVKDLLPKLPAHSVIVMDNARFHKRSDMIEAIEEQGHIADTVELTF
ncbi:transposase [Piscirickettsia salmonis]|uniref:transposase n=1 Tax=Piscirickettsia salmonis TaxID=1238 RepID=UPI00249D9BDA|nr:transposase [Piscirickettsia salmonis]